MRVLAKIDGGVRAVLKARAARPAAALPPDRSISPRLDAAEKAHRRMIAGNPAPRRYRLPGYGGWWVPEEDTTLAIYPNRALSEWEVSQLEAARLRGAMRREARREQVTANPALIDTYGFDRKEMAKLRATEADDRARIDAARRGGGA